MPARGLAVYGALCLAAFCEAAHAAPEGIIELDHATLVATVNGWPQPSQEIRLPLHWDVIYRGRSGTARLTLPFARPRAHTVNEHVPIEDLVHCAQGIAIAGWRLCR